MLHYLYNFLVKCLDFLKDEAYPRYTEELITWEKLNELHAHIQQNINNLTELDQEALSNPLDYLTMYCAFDIDEKYILQLISLKTTLTQVFFDEISFFDDEIIGPCAIDAVITATAFGKERNFQMLAKSNKYGYWSFEIAAVIAAYRGQKNILSYLLAHKALSHKIEDCYKSTILLAAIQGAHPDIFALLLTYNPPEKLFWEGMCSAGENNQWNAIRKSPYITAVDIGSQESLQCAQMIENTEAGMWDRLNLAIKALNLNTFNSLLEKFKGKNVFLFRVAHAKHMGGSVLMSHNTLVSALSADNHEAFAILFNLLLKGSFTSELIINTLLDTLSYFPSKPIAGPLVKVYEDCWMKFIQYIDTHQSSLKLTINAWSNKNQEILEKCYSVISANVIPVEEIVLLGCDRDSPNTNDLVRLISALLKNTSVLKCNLNFPKTYPQSKVEPCRVPLLALYELILQRNKKMAKFKCLISKDKIYNQYLESINNCIEKITAHKQACFPNDDLEKITLFKTKLYSLKELAGLTLFINKSGKEKALAEKEEELNEITALINCDGIYIIQDLMQEVQQEKLASL